MNLDEIFSAMPEAAEETWTRDTRYEEYPVYVDDNGYVQIDGRTIGDMTAQESVQGDKQSQYIAFVMPRYYDGIDRTSMILQVYYELTDGTGNSSTVVNVYYSDENIRFGWIIPEDAAYKAEKILIAVWYTGVSPTGAEYRWSTIPKQYEIKEGLVIGVGIPQPDNGWYQQFVSDMIGYLNQAKGYRDEAEQFSTSAGESATRAAESAQSVADSMQQIETNKQNIEKHETELSDARVGYFGKEYESLGKRIDGDINAIIDKVDTANYKDTSIHATNTYARNLTANGNKVEILGQTIQNCLDASSANKYIDSSVLTFDENGYISITANGSYLVFATKLESTVLKPSTLYTFVLDVIENTLKSSGTNNIVFGNSTESFPSKFADKKMFNLQGIGITKFTLTTRESFESCVCSTRDSILAEVTSGSITFRYAIIEGDWTEKEISFVPFGLNTPESTEVKMVGKNWFDGEIELGTLSYGNEVESSTLYRSTNYINVEPNTEYCFSLNGVKNRIVVSCYDENNAWMDTTGNSNGLASTTGLFTTPYNCKKIKIRIYTDDFEIAKDGKWQIQLASDEDYTYEPYTGNAVAIPHSLGSVSDTVRDRVYLKDGKAYYEQNTKEIVFDGSDNVIWSLNSGWADLNDYAHFYTSSAKLNLKNDSDLLCDNFPNKRTNDTNGAPIGKQAFVSSAMYLVLNKSELSSVDKAGLNKWLQNNPTTVIYQLKTPITTEISIEDYYSYAEQTNWYTTNTVKPTIDVDIPSNLTALVSNLMVENSALQKENTVLSAQVEQQTANIDYIRMMTVLEG